MKRILFFVLLVTSVTIPLKAQNVIGVAILKTVDEIGDVPAGVK